MPQNPLTYVLGAVLVLMLLGLIVAALRGWLTVDPLDLGSLTPGGDDSDGDTEDRS